MTAFNGRHQNETFRAVQQRALWPVGSAESRRTVIDGFGIAWYDSFREVPETQAEPVILIHGFCSMSYTWHEVIDQLAARRVIAVDLKGFGASDKPADSNYLVDTQAGIVAGLMDELRLDRVALVGNSLGGAVALRMAQRWAQRVTRLVLACPAVWHVDRFPLLARLVVLANQRISERFSARVIGRLTRIPGLIESRMRHAYYRAATVTPERVAAYSAMLNEPDCQRAIAATLKTFDLRPVARHLSSVHQPVLIVQGAHDKIIPPSSSEALARALPHAELKMLPCGHAPQEELPAEFAQLVNVFLEPVQAAHPASQAVR
ncbi:MAG: alpha/beta fold hydrolase [Blastocatellia bacterium]